MTIPKESLMIPEETVRRRLDPDRLLAEARRIAGLEHFGNEDFVVALRKTTRFAMEELTFKVAGLEFVEEILIRSLVNRLRFHRDVTLHPEILHEDVSDPIIVTGMPRTGTTKLQRVLSAMPGTQALWLWRALNPARVDAQACDDVPRRKALARAYQAHMAQFSISHDTEIDLAEEDSLLLMQAFEYFLIIGFVPSRGLLNWIRERPREIPYQYQRRMLQYLQWQDGGKQGRRWILKNPGHLGELDVIADVYPNAHIICTQREIGTVMASYCYLMEAMWSATVADISAEAIGRHAVEYWGPELQRYESSKARLGSRIRLLEIPYSDLVTDDEVVIRRIYEFVGMSYGETEQRALTAWTVANRQHPHGKPDYTLEQFGLSQDSLLTDLLDQVDPSPDQDPNREAR